MTAIPEIGAMAPDFQIEDMNGVDRSLQDFRGRWFILYFYPKDDTPGCTTEAKEFSAVGDRLAANNAVAMGVSLDPPEKHRKFAAKHDLTVMLATGTQDMLGDYGVWVEKNMYGKKYMGIQRATFLIDPSGKIAHVWPKVRVKGHVDAVMETLESAIAEAPDHEFSDMQGPD